VSNGIQDEDIVVVRKVAAYEISRFMNGSLDRLEGPYDRPTAEARAKALAQEHQSDAWIQEFPTAVRLLED